MDMKLLKILCVQLLQLI